jgi:DNA ligase 1
MALEKDGDTCEVQGSGAKPYVLKYIGGVYSCSCPAWRNQSAPIDKRTCKHLKKIRGEVVEIARVAGVVLSPENLALDAALKKAQEARRPALKRATASFKTRITEKLAPKKAEDFAAGVRAVEMDDEEEAEPVDVRDAPFEDDEDGSLERQRIMARAYDERRALRPDEKAKLDGPPILLALPFEDADIDPTDWWMSEKLDGVRAYWNGREFISRQGNVFQAPEWYTKLMPRHPVDGELWMGRKMFQKTISVVKSIDAGERWREVKYLAFDLPHLKTGFESRMRELKTTPGPKWMTVVEQKRCNGLPHLRSELDRLVALGAEGIMLRQPNSIYVPARSSTLLKVKLWKDAEARVLSYEPGRGRHWGRLGALVVETLEPVRSERIRFKLGTGLSDEDRRNPPPIGSVITFRYMDKTDGGVPKGASFVAVRNYE